jgi:hypothetical protein
LLMLALATASTVPAISAPVAVELLAMRAATILAAVSPVSPVSAVPAFSTVVAVMMAVLPVLPVLTRPLFLVAGLPRGALLLLAGFGGCLADRGRGWCGWGVLSRDGGGGSRRCFGHIATLGWRLGGPVEVRVRLACVIGGRTAVRARPSAATMRASTFGHAAVFVMGCELTTARRLTPVLPRGAPVVNRSHVTAREPLRATNDARGVRFGRLPERRDPVVRASHDRCCRRRARTTHAVRRPFLLCAR